MHAQPSSVAEGFTLTESPGTHERTGGLRGTNDRTQHRTGRDWGGPEAEDSHAGRDQGLPRRGGVASDQPNMGYFR
eukprot:COSAG06_NODE_768_length_12452_cov_5.484537_2_plen_76_part_00